MSTHSHPAPRTQQSAPGKSALVTGGTRGIGLGIARALAREGWNLALCGVRPEGDVSPVVDELRSSGVTVTYHVCDVAVAADRARLVEGVRGIHGVVNALVNNAGRAPRVRADLLESTEPDFETLLRTNLQGPYFLTQLVARDQVARKSIEPSFRAAIVFITSVSADLASTNRGDYCVSKAGLSMAARVFAVRLAEHHIPVYEVRPGIIETDMTAKVKDDYDRRIADGLVPEQRWGVPDDVARVVAALLRGDAPYATGSVINVDGGLSLPRL
jgi:NAD(P)-dependent dehydrogenase (short-subunit alcohol dehydrogenase family)